MNKEWWAVMAQWADPGEIYACMAFCHVSSEDEALGAAFRTWGHHEGVKIIANKCPSQGDDK